MPDIPQEAVRAVAEILRSWDVDRSGEGDIAPVEEFDDEARELLEAALPHMLPARRAASRSHIVLNLDPLPACPHCRGACACRRL